MDNNFDNSNINKINWFPGHMKKATDEIIKKIKDVDFIIEVLDARAIKTTSNHELIKYVDKKPIIHVALKKDLSDVKDINLEHLIIGSTKDKSLKQKILNELNVCLQDKIQRLKNKGLVNFQLIGLVLGIPNVGKSSLINYLSNNNNLIVENRAGVTKKQVIKKINNNFYLIDTPGVLFKKIENIEDGYKLSILNNIANKVLPMYDVLKFHYEYLLANYHEQLFKYFNLTKDLNFDEFINYVANKYKFIIKNNEIDIERTFAFLFNIFSKSEICAFHYF